MARVVHVTSVHGPFDSRIFEKECQSLRASGHEVTLVAPHSREERIQEIRIIPVGAATGRLRRMFQVSRRAIETASREQADIYHLHDPELLVWKGILTRRGAVVVYDMHEDFPKQIRNKRWLAGPVRPFLALLARRWEELILRDVPVVLAEMSYASNRPWLHRKVVVMNFPRLDIMDNLPRPENEEGGFRVGYLGAVTAPRGSFIYLDAMAIVKDRLGEEIPLDLVGNVDPAHRREIEKKVSELGLNRVELTGQLTPREGWRRMGSFHVGLAALAPSRNFVGSYPTKLFEYMSLGIPSIVSDFPLYREVVEKSGCGVLVDPLEPNEIAEAVIRFKKNPELRKGMARQGRQAVRRHYSWDSQAETLADFYADILGHGDSGRP